MATVYEAETGRILFATTSTLPAFMQDLSQAPNQIVMEGFFDSAQFYVVEHEALPRPLLVAETSHEFTAGPEALLLIEDVPAGTMVRIGDGAPAGVDDGRIELVFNLAGSFLIGIEPPFPFLPQVLKVVSNAL